jgi:hypothetical protein
MPTKKERANKLGCSIDQLPDGRGKHGHHARGARHAQWNNGTYTGSNGYIAIAVPVGHHLRMANGYAYVHQLVAEEVLGRELLPGETVHHVNGIKTDNQPENLKVMSRSEHAVLETNIRPRDKFGRLTEKRLPEPVRNRLGQYVNTKADLPEDLRIREFPL